MYSVGVVPGKFFPPHRGHLDQIIRAGAVCDKVYIVVSDNESIAIEKCRKDNLPYIPMYMRARWLSIETKDMDNMEVIILDESGMPPYPDGSEQWCAALTKLIPEKFDVIFGGDYEYRDTYTKHLPDIKYYLTDRRAGRYSTSGTVIRGSYLRCWTYILGSARPFFARRVLITGPDSCGKTTLTRYLAKIFNTSWSEEYGRHYSRDFMGGNEALFRPDDFARICQIQRDQDEDALKNANKIVFFDTDAVVTQFYCEIYMGHSSPAIEEFVDHQKYDAVLMLKPSVKWIPDGLRFKGDQKEREFLYEKLCYMYVDRGFEDKIIQIDNDTYVERLDKACEVVDELLENQKFMSRY
jgi:HTH-type transcriptional repressor of NAD biosynthesis genes